MKNFTLIIVFLFFISSNLSSQNALHFDGADDYVQTTFPGVSGSNARTIEAWIKTTANSNPSAGGVQNVIVDWGVFGTGTRFTLNVLWSNAIRVEVGGSGLSGSVAVNDGNWHHVAVVYNPTATSKLSLYVDGVLDVAGNISTAINTASNGFMQIGRRVDGINPFSGAIDEVRVWNTARTVSQLNANKNIEYCGLPANLIAYYKFNQGIAASSNTGVSSLIEYSSNSYTGTLHNFALSGSSSNWVSGASLTAGAGTSSSYSVNACDSYTSPSGNYTWNTSGIYVDTIANVSGCDSIMTINVNILNATTSSFSVSSCNEYISPSGKVWNTSNTYTDTIANAVGCDSIMTIYLTINTVDTSITASGIKLRANASGLSYQWINCSNGNAIIAGATAQVFVANANGSYAVIISTSNCTDTSSCYTINQVGFNSIEQDNIATLFPNPASDYVSLDLHKKCNQVLVEVVDINGKQVFEQEYINSSSVKVDIQQFNSGLYYLKLITKDGVQLLKFIKK